MDERTAFATTAPPASRTMKRALRTTTTRMPLPSGARPVPPTYSMAGACCVPTADCGGPSLPTQLPDQIIRLRVLANPVHGFAQGFHEAVDTVPGKSEDGVDSPFDEALHEYFCSSLVCHLPSFARWSTPRRRAE